MKIENLTIANFRGISKVELSRLGSVVIIAGQNGSGKSCVFDAIRLLKSVYGGYQANEWQQWMGEFQIGGAGRTPGFSSMLNNPSKELRITCDFKFAEEERKYMTTNADQLLRETIWRTILPEAYGWGTSGMARFAAQFRDREPEVAERARHQLPIFLEQLAAPTVRGEIYISSGDALQTSNSLALTVAFTTFRPTDIGVIDYHGAQRHYGRENVQGINLNLEAHEQQRSQTALYNYAGKYGNVKSEMAGTYVKELLSEKAGVDVSTRATLTSTLQELFATFFPDKKFLGPQATTGGALTFPVLTGNGSQHDLDELSAGEKEILYGYLRIRNSAPKYSIILLDEPELHLNPRLIRGLPQFYKKNLGEALGNQIWLVSHSDALLREVVDRDGYSVFHMLPCSKAAPSENQLKPLSVTADLDLALIDLVGDLASYKPNGKVVIFEGGGDSDFDQKVASALFPELAEQANFVSGTNKARVRALHETLDQASQKGHLPFKFFAITDRDSENLNSGSLPVNFFQWDVYHIENYFLDPKYISRVLAALSIQQKMTDEEIWDQLRICAQDSLSQLVRHELAEHANSQLMNCINTSTDPKAADVAGTLHQSIVRSSEKLKKILEEKLNIEKLKGKEEEYNKKYNTSLGDGTWVKSFRGRDILRRFAGKHASSVSYEVFRNLVLSQMRDDGYQPPGMKAVFAQILGA